jgi:hypothetical protein
MTYTTAEGRQQILDALGAVADEIGVALAYASEAWEHLDEYTAERLEGEIFQPIQAAYGGAKRTHTRFAERYGLPGRAFASPSPPAPGGGGRGMIEAAADAAGKADGGLIALQDSMLPVEVGDAELRAGLAGVRESLGQVRARARGVVRTLGR